MSCPMMDMAAMGWVMAGIGFISLLLVVALLLSIAALWKYLRLGHARPTTT